MSWQLDPYHTQVEFSAKHLGMMTVRGLFKDVTASGVVDPEHPDASSFEVTIQAGSVTTHHEQRDNDLKTSNFLEIEKYPTLHFKSTKVEQVSDDRFNLIGDLTIKGVTHPVTLAVLKYGEFNDPRMGHRIGYSAETQINRKDFGMTFNMLMDGKWIVSDEIKIMIEGELVEQQ